MLVPQRPDTPTFQEKAIEPGMRTPWQDGGEKVLAGMTTLEEPNRVPGDGQY